MNENDKKDFDYDLFMETEDYISLDDFSPVDKTNIIKYNGCGNIVFHVKTKTDEFDEIWLFDNDDEKINPDEKKLYEIKPFIISKNNNLELVKEGELENISITFEYFDENMIETILRENQSAVENGELEVSYEMDLTFNKFDEKSKELFRKYNGHGDIVQFVITRTGLNFQQKWNTNGISDYYFKDITDKSIVYIQTEPLKINPDVYPKQNILRYEYTFEPFADNHYLNLNKPLKPNFNYDGYMKNVNELIGSTLFDDDDIALMIENKGEGLVCYEFETIHGTVRDCYRISQIYKKKENSFVYHSDESVTEYDSEINYMIRLYPYKLNKKNRFTIPPIERIGFGEWWYSIDLDIITLSDFSDEDYKNILKYNGCGNIVVKVKTKNDYFEEKWIFGDKISDDLSKSLTIFLLESNDKNSSQFLSFRDIENIQYTFEPYDKEKIDEILEERSKMIEDGLCSLTLENELYLDDFDDKSKSLFKKYAGKGVVVRTIKTRSGINFKEEWKFNSVEREVLLSQINDDTILKIEAENIDNKYNIEFYPDQDFLDFEYSFELFSKEKYDELSSVEEFDYDDYMKNASEFIEGFEFSDEDYELIEENKGEGLVYYEFKTIYDEIIRDYYVIEYMIKHDVDTDLNELAQEIDIEKLSEEEIEEFKKEFDYYDLEVIPYRLGERNDFTVPEIEKFGSGQWHYQKDKKIND